VNCHVAKDITITWRAFHGDPSRPEFAPEQSKTFTLDVPVDMSDLAVCEWVYRDTNLYTGPAWDAMQPLPEPRSHTALSVIFGHGDHVTIDGRTYEIASSGFKEVAA
jgi:hypothetical protein